MANNLAKASPFLWKIPFSGKENHSKSNKVTTSDGRHAVPATLKSFSVDITLQLEYHRFPKHYEIVKTHKEFKTLLL